MDSCTHRQVAVVASRIEDFLRVAEQERRAANAIATRRRASALSGNVSRASFLESVQGLIALMHSLGRSRAQRTAAWRGNPSRNPVG